MIAEALRYADDPNAPRVEGDRRRRRRRPAAGGAGESWGGRTRRVLMTGVSYMIPFVAAGGLLIALSFLLGGYEIVGPAGDIARQQLALQPARPRAPSASTTRCSTPASSPTSARCSSSSARPRSCSSSRRWPATSPTRSPTDRASPPASSWAAWPPTLGSVGTAAATGFLGGIIGGVLAGVDRALDHQLEGADLGARPDAGAGHPAVHLDDRRLLMIIVFGKPIGWLMDAADRRPELA